VWLRRARDSPRYAAPAVSKDGGDLGLNERAERSFDRLLAPLVKPIAWLTRPWARRRHRETEARRETFRSWRERRGLVQTSESRFAGATAGGFPIEVTTYQPEISVSVTLAGIDPPLLSGTGIFRLSLVAELFGSSDRQEGRLRTATRGDFTVVSDEIDPGELARWADESLFARVRPLREIEIQDGSVCVNAGGLDRGEDWDALVDGAAALIEWLNRPDRPLMARRSVPESSSS
jgi:hypothetical protein